MATRSRPQVGTWLGRLANELYLGAMVMGAVTVIAGLVAVAVIIAMRVSTWVQMAD